jgi:hypothetical protein
VNGYRLREHPILDFYLRLRYPDPPIMEMHAIKREELERFLELSGARILGVVESQAAGPDWISYRYCVTKMISFQTPNLEYKELTAQIAEPAA